VHNLQIRNSTDDPLLYITSESKELNDLDIIITDDLQINQSDSDDIYTIV